MLGMYLFFFIGLEFFFLSPTHKNTHRLRTTCRQGCQICNNHNKNLNSFCFELKTDKTFLEPVFQIEHS